MSNKIYPIGIQNFEKIRKGGYCYIDKTAWIYQMVKTGSYYFLSRPRRFGKSLLLSTLEAYFQGKKGLFEGLAIEKLEKDWIKYPILHLDLNAEKYTNPEALDQVLESALRGWEAVSSLEKKYSKQIHSILEEQHLMEAERMQIPAKLKNLQSDYASWKTKEEEWKRGCVEELQAQLNDIGHRLYVAAGEKEKHLAEREKLLKACRKVYNDSRTELRKELEEFVASVQQEIERMKQQTEERKKELKQAQENELNGKGADTVTIRKYDDRLAEINKELDYIGKSRPQVHY